jgi:hypothetical protein
MFKRQIRPFNRMKNMINMKVKRNLSNRIAFKIQSSKFVQVISRLYCKSVNICVLFVKATMKPKKSLKNI